MVGVSMNLLMINLCLFLVLVPKLCNDYELIEYGEDYEIRSPLWMSTAPIDDISATNTGFLTLFDYIQGEEQLLGGNRDDSSSYHSSDGPFCASSFVVSFYVPKKNQQNPPPAKGLHLQKWGKTYIAVRQFSGFVADDDIPKQAAALSASIAGTKWEAAIDKSQAADSTTMYTVAGYNSPF